MICELTSAFSHLNQQNTLEVPLGKESEGLKGARFSFIAGAIFISVILSFSEEKAWHPDMVKETIRMTEQAAMRVFLTAMFIMPSV